MSAAPAVSLAALTAAARDENRHAARKIAACYDVHRTWITRDIKHKHYSRYGRTEMALALGCSATVAESYVSIAVALHTRLPLLRAAFSAGEIDLARVRTACRILDNLSDDLVARVEAEVVDAARQNSPGPLENAIWEILVRVAPEEAAALREFAKKFRTVTFSSAGELARIRAELTAPEAAAAWQLLEEMADTLCPKDPRGKKERLCDAFMARMHGESRLVCQCQRPTCPKKDAGAVLPDRRVPLTMITVDIATLIGLLANPAYLAGHGSIDPELARELARTSQWQILLTDAVTLAESLGLAQQNPETGDWERTPTNDKDIASPNAETEPAAEAAPAAAAAANSATDTGTAANETEPGASTDTEPASETRTESGIATGTSIDTDPDTDTATVPGTDPPCEPANRTDTESTTAPSPATVPKPTPGRGADPGHGSNSASPHAASPRGPVGASGPPADLSRASDPRQIHFAAEQPERSSTGSPTPSSGPAPATDSARGTHTASVPPPEPRKKTPPEPNPNPVGAAPQPAPGTDGTAEPSGEEHRRRTQSLTSAAALFCTHTPLGRGTRHSSALDLTDIRHPARNMRALDLRSTIQPNNRTIHAPAGLYLGNASLTAALEAAIAADPTLGKSVPRDPLTDRALIYRPDTLTTTAVRQRDRHCRFPGCHRPAARCQLDHIIAFDHTNPLGGGWTTINNLQCLCEFHHSVKTAGYWTATMLPGGALLWTSTSKTTRITLPANGTAAPILGNDLRPHIPTKPRRSGIIAYPNPPDTEQPETNDTTAPPF
ncbi:DUF222 domain-containing protein [Rhodococcus sp. 077-4]|uniref:HNH endonuclease signature motif containing protein n=1 Tax=Rhodococcus sp. 077-4 TaxID=2789271 RepID=UPI0039F548BD